MTGRRRARSAQLAFRPARRCRSRVPDAHDPRGGRSSSPLPWPTRGTLQPGQGAAWGACAYYVSYVYGGFQSMAWDPRGAPTVDAIIPIFPLKPLEVGQRHRERAALVRRAVAKALGCRDQRAAARADGVLVDDI